MPSGGERQGAGRPKELAKTVREARLVARQLSDALKMGLKSLSDEYDSLVQRAIDIAKGGDSAMLRFLIELPTRLIKLEGDEETPFQRLIKEVGAPKELHLHQHIVRQQ